MSEKKLIARSRIIEVARSWLAVPYRHQGRTRKGIDCIGLIAEVGAGIGLDVPIIPNNYTQNPSSDLLVRSCEQHLQSAVDDQLLAPGSIAVMWGFDRGQAQHFAVVGDFNGSPTMIHAFSKRAQVVECLWDDFWRRRFVRVYEYPDTEPMAD